MKTFKEKAGCFNATASKSQIVNASLGNHRKKRGVGVSECCGIGLTIGGQVGPTRLYLYSLYEGRSAFYYMFVCF